MGDQKMKRAKAHGTGKSLVMSEMIAAAIVISVIFWLIDSFIAGYFLGETSGHLTLLRVFITLLFVMCGIAAGFVLLRKRRLEMQLTEIGEMDSLTKVYNRKMFMSFLDKELHRSARYKKDQVRKDPALIMFDVDHLRKINDGHGNDVGDDVLTAVSMLVKANVRKADILSRFGGEEFMIIAPETNIEGAKMLAEKIRNIVEKHSFDVVRNITISVGIAAYKANDTLDRLINRVEKALLKAKRRGRNRVEASNL